MSGMESLMTTLSTTEKVIGSIIAIGVSVKVFGSTIWKWYSRINKYVTNTSKTLEAMRMVSRELMPNHGTSLRDSINRIEKLVTISSQRHRAVLHELGTSAWEADADGNFQWGSRSFLQLCDRTNEELMDNGWANCISPEDREFVWKEWKTAVIEERDLDVRFRLIRPNGELICVHVHAYALKRAGSDGELLGYWSATKPICGSAGEVCPIGTCAYGGVFGSRAMATSGTTPLKITSIDN